MRTLTHHRYLGKYPNGQHPLLHPRNFEINIKNRTLLHLIDFAPAARSVHQMHHPLHNFQHEI